MSDKVKKLKDVSGRDLVVPRDDFDEFVLRASTGGSLPSTPATGDDRVVISCGNRRWYMDQRFTAATEDTDPDDTWDTPVADSPPMYTPYKKSSLPDDRKYSGVSSTSSRGGLLSDGESDMIPLLGRDKARGTRDAEGTVYWQDLLPRPRVSSFSSLPHERPPRRTEETIEAHLNHHHGPEGAIKRVRSFRITSKGLVNEDKEKSSKGISRSLKSRRRDPLPVKNNAIYRVLVMGAVGVGKKALIHDFMIPDFHPFVSCSFDDEGDKSVSVLLDGEESTMEFVDLSDQELTLFVAADQIDAYVVVYSVEDRKSFETAIDRLFEIRQEEGRTVAVILVANKTDLVRSRVVLAEEGKSAAKTYDCKYIEVSAAIDHKIDELLVGILKQIRLLKQRREKHRSHSRKFPAAEDYVNDSCCPLANKPHVLGKFFRVARFQSKSCDNLYVL